MNKKVILMILDGWGIAENPEVSAIDKANTPFVDSLYTKYAHSKLLTSGKAVGLPDGQMGNSEVGHMNLGAGRIVYQMLERINQSIEKGDFFNIDVLKKAFQYAKENDKQVHFLGLTSTGGVHSHINHLKALCKAAGEAELEKVFIHAFTDGRDTDPKSGKGNIEEIQTYAKETTGKIATVIGRYYAMDRDKRWERTKLAYDALVNGEGKQAEDAVKAVQESYDEDVTDEFIKPIVCTENGKPVATIQEGDVVISFNFRTDRARQITLALTQKDFSEQNMKKLDLNYITMTEYDETFKGVNILFDNKAITQVMGEVLAAHGKKQIRIAETEKYPHVTFFFNCGREEEFEGEERIMCPSPKVATYDLQPEMSAGDIRDSIIPKLKEGEVDFVCLNFANADMVGHTGVFEAAVKACETVDQCAKAVTEVAQENGYSVLIIADHGNSDQMKNPDGTPHTQHTTVPVPCILVDNDYKGKIKDGKLGDISPTILALMGIEQPKEMTGESLLEH
ncbi:2,3-bisphosphoglycerate-independent phosphoglycerate mutase [Catalinimonas alkaloidigena]|uniref:2,3-bisphosphoglycerate-independent phosphoglycerate mutase n=1 Tax=Catalinimonas alkaloidigena TaxID=1075417 RepID=UPI0024076E0F|nr:2,3-bisphosphoglycerate-independent phosphoglycerate mutase [Catalinimonas alkaloidigena]MDF9796187.1 2,3-bisphosphoglycerate-independent phosphoglycerate mutase [Catalinimonas alkaloidigena]